MRGTILLISSMMTLLVGCSTGNLEADIRNGAETATYVALVATEADAQEAEQIRAVSVMVQDLMDGDTVDPSLIRTFIEAEFGQIPHMTFIVNRVANRISERLAKEEVKLGETELRLIILAAAEGVESGAEFYLLEAGEE